MAEADAAPQFRVTGELVYLKTNTAYGVRLIGFKKNALVPSDVPQEQIDHHLRVKLIAPLVPVEAEAALPPARGRKTPAGG